jgi:hypothetical protein
MTSYTHAEVEKAWKRFSSTMVYRYLVAGKWHTTTEYNEARDAKPIKIDVKKAKDVLDFPHYLRLTYADHA